MRKIALAFLFLLLYSLPAVAQRKQTDREYDGLKGPVKSVVTERADFKNPKTQSGVINRRRDSELTYDKDGNRLTRKFYNFRSGELFDSARFGLIDGAKVLIDDPIDSPNRLTGRAEGDETPKNLDPRYTFKFIYKYDASGRVSEVSWIQNDGKLWLRYVYSFKGNQIEELVYDRDGKLNQKSVQIFDDKQNEIEAVYYDVEKNKPSSRELFVNVEFDAKGNWTKRTVSYSDGKSRSFIQSKETMFRTILYY